MAEPKRLYKTKEGAVLGGVLKGFSEVYNMDVSLVRIIYIFLSLFAGLPLIIYIVLYFVIPNKDDIIETINKDSISDDFDINKDDYRY